MRNKLGTRIKLQKIDMPSSVDIASLQKLNQDLNTVLASQKKSLDQISGQLNQEKSLDKFSGQLNPSVVVPPMKPQNKKENPLEINFTELNQNLDNILALQQQSNSSFEATGDVTGLMGSNKSQYFQTEFKPRSNLYLSGVESSPANLLARVPLIQAGSDDSSKKTLQEFLGGIELASSVNQARQRIGEGSIPTKEHYDTALVQQSVIHDVINGFVLGNNSEILNKKLEALDPKYRDALKSKGFTDSSARERYLAMLSAYQDQGFNDSSNPLKVVMEDVLTRTINELKAKGKTLEVNKRNDKGELVKDESGKILKEAVTISNFTKYLDDTGLQNAINTYVKSNADYHKGDYERIIADYQAKNPDIVPVTYSDEPQSTSKRQIVNIQHLYTKIEEVSSKPYILDESSNPQSKSKEIRDQERWNDYQDIQWNAQSKQGLFFKTSGAKERTEKLYKELVSPESFQRMDQFTVLVLTLLKIAKDGKKLTNEQRQFLEDISSSADSWTPSGGSTSSIDKALESIKFK